MDSESEYVLGTGDEEIHRLGLQHQAWQAQAHEGWERAGFKSGHVILDLGSGPGHATFDLAQVVGAQGRIIAVDLSRRFLDHLEREARARGFMNIGVLERNAQDLDLPAMSLDGAWARWVLSFTPEPERVVTEVASALRSGGVFLLHEYASYSAMRLAPPSDALAGIVSAIQASWKQRGGDPDVALRIPAMLERAGFDIRELRPIARMARPNTLLWRWPESFFKNYLPVLEQQGFLSPDLRRAFEADWQLRSSDQTAFYFCPVVLEIVAVKR